MAMFSLFKRGRQAAKEHKAKEAERQKDEPAKVPYRHVPTHAAHDALSSAPSTSKHQDRTKILEANRRRSEIYRNQSAMSSMDMNMAISNPVHMIGGLPRANSTLSHVSYPTVNANPVTPPRSYSYSSAPTSWAYQQVGLDQSNSTSWKGKGKEVERRASNVPVQAQTRMSSIMDVAPGSSSGESIGSQDGLEMKTASRHSVAVQPANGTGINTQIEQFRCPPTIRSASSPNGADLQRVKLSPARFPSPLAMAPTDIPPVPILPPNLLTGPVGGVMPSSASMNDQSLSTATTATDLPSLKNDKRSSPTSSLRDSAPLDSLSPDGSENETATWPMPLHVSYKSQRISKTARFSEMETINAVDPPRMAANEKTRPTVQTSSLPTEFEFDFDTLQSAASAASATRAAQKTGKLSEAPGGKLAKKSRWSMSRSSAVAT